MAVLSVPPLLAEASGALEDGLSEQRDGALELSREVLTPDRELEALMHCESWTFMSSPGSGGNQGTILENCVEFRYCRSHCHCRRQQVGLQ